MDTELANTVIQVDVAVLAFVAGTVIPLLTALLTKLKASSGVKAMCSLVLAMISAAVAYLTLNSGQANLLELVAAVVAVYVGAGVSYQNFWKPTGVTLKIAEATAGVGLGSAAKPEQAQVAPDTDEA